MEESLYIRSRLRIICFISGVIHANLGLVLAVSCGMHLFTPFSKSVLNIFQMYSTDEFGEFDILISIFLMWSLSNSQYASL